MKIYTKTGDDGDTGLFGGGRVGKEDDRVEAYGEVDELNSVLGLARAEGLGSMDALAQSLQDQLFTIGEQGRIVSALRAGGVRTTFARLDSLAGHDAFLVDFASFDATIRPWLEVSG